MSAIVLVACRDKGPYGCILVIYYIYHSPCVFVTIHHHFVSLLSLPKPVLTSEIPTGTVGSGLQAATLLEAALGMVMHILGPFPIWTGGI